MSSMPPDHRIPLCIPDLQLVPMSELRPNPRRGAAGSQEEGGLDDLRDTPPPFGPLTITVRFFLDTDPEVSFTGIAPWLASEVLMRASYLLEVANEEEEEE